MSRYQGSISAKFSREQHKFLASIEAGSMADALRICVQFMMEAENQEKIIRRAIENELSKSRQENHRVIEELTNSFMSDNLENTKRLSQNLTTLTDVNRELASSVSDLPRQVGQMVKNVLEIVFPERFKRKSAASAQAKKAAG
ncbi:hypothetical protein [Spongiibacter tropicus]|uniref:hypothetical protein n=1 Tax=Spongiibacter tropicus TaxID=454602 RepID=UPI002357AAB1|nr:hypothetical protein [Spongiibacter tropicus]|tara:strand:- start:98 stop:526 length:429 start_codon:yes stop_codon:yes gene_type:complete